MNVETLIYAYLAVCVSMIIFNCVCIFVFRRQDTELRKHSGRLKTDVTEQILRIEAGEKIEEKHEKFLRKKLTRTNNLLAFDKTLEQLYQQGNRSVLNYLKEIRPVFSYLAAENKYHSPMKLTYFSYFLCKSNKERPPFF